MSKDVVSRKRKRKIFQPSPGGIAYVNLVRAADRLKTHIENILAPFEITGQQYNVLRILRGAEPDGLPTLMIAKRMIERTPGITRMIDRLEAKGLAVRELRLTDRRYVYCRVTEKGLQLLDLLDAPIDATNDGFRGINELELAQLTVLLEKVWKSLESNQQEEINSEE